MPRGAAGSRSFAADDAKIKPLQVLLVCGGCCHDYDNQKVFLSKGMEERAHVQSISLQRWNGAADAGRWQHQSSLPVPAKEKVVLAA